MKKHFIRLLNMNLTSLQESKWQVLGGEVLINLVKQEKFVWPRLLKAKIKVILNLKDKSRIGIIVDYSRDDTVVNGV